MRSLTIPTFALLCCALLPACGSGQDQPTADSAPTEAAGRAIGDAGPADVTPAEQSAIDADAANPVEPLDFGLELAPEEPLIEAEDVTVRHARTRIVSSQSNVTAEE